MGLNLVRKKNWNFAARPTEMTDIKTCALRGMILETSFGFRG